MHIIINACCSLKCLLYVARPPRIFCQEREREQYFRSITQIHLVYMEAGCMASTPRTGPSTKYICTSRVPQCLSPRWNWDSPTPSPASKCAPPESRGGGGYLHTRLRVRGWGSPNTDDWRESLLLCLLCGSKYLQYSYI